MITEVLNTIQKIIASNPSAINWDLNQRLINATKHLLLTNSSHLVKSQALVLLSYLAPIASDSSLDSSAALQSVCISIIKILREFSHYFDPRVRCAALESILFLHERGIKLDISLYCEFCEGLSDDYEGCRMASIKLLEVLSHIYRDW